MQHIRNYNTLVTMTDQ